MFYDITDYKFCTENFKTAPFSNPLPKGISQFIWSCSSGNVCFLTLVKSNFCNEKAQISFSLKDSMNFVFDVTKSEFTIEKFKMEAIFQMAAKIINT